MRGRIKRPFTVIAATTMALLIAAPATTALAKAAPAGKGGGSGTTAAAAAAAKGGGSGTQEGTGGSGSSAKGNKGSANKGGTTKKGTTFADLVQVLRNVDGVPITARNDAAGVDCVQPITIVNTGSPAPTDVTVYPYGVDMYLIPLVGGSDPAVACDVDATKGFTAVEVDLGRLSVGRSPESVLAKQLADVITALQADAEETLDASGRIVANDAAIDSPLQSLAIYQSLLEKGTLTGLQLSAAYPTISSMDLAAAAFAAAADKTTTQTIDAVQYMNRILKIATDTTLPALPFLGVDKQYLSFRGFSYDRAKMFPGYITYWDLTDVNNPVAVKDAKIIDVVFGGHGTGLLSNAKAFATMVDDARQVLLFVHDNVEISVDPMSLSTPPVLTP